MNITPNIELNKIRWNYSDLTNHNRIHKVVKEFEQDPMITTVNKLYWGLLQDTSITGNYSTEIKEALKQAYIMGSQSK